MESLLCRQQHNHAAGNLHRFGSQKLLQSVHSDPVILRTIQRVTLPFTETDVLNFSPRPS